DRATAGTTKAQAGRVTPLSEARYAVQFTADDELRDLIERAQDLTRHSNPRGDLATIVKSAMTDYVAKLEKKRLAKTSRPKQTASAEPTKAGYVTNEVHRQVFERDGAQCGYIDAE